MSQGEGASKQHDEDEEQSEHEASQPPRKRGRFENERSDSMSQGEGASKQHGEDGEPVTKAQKQRLRKRMEGSARKSGDQKSYEKDRSKRRRGGGVRENF